MQKEFSPSLWKAVKRAGLWQIIDENERKVATIEESKNSQKDAKLIAASPYLLEALKAIAELIGEEDLPDNGELSGTAVSDMVRTAITLVKD